jgi:hypothetical protein
MKRRCLDSQRSRDGAGLATRRGVGDLPDKESVELSHRGQGHIAGAGENQVVPMLRRGHMVMKDER